jgi:hypothetical protein
LQQVRLEDDPVLLDDPEHPPGGLLAYSALR